MRLSDTELTSICERASTLAERMIGQYVPVSDDTSLASRRLARWQHLSGKDWRHQLAARLAALGKDPIPESKLLALLGNVKRATNVPLPPWASFLNEVAESVAQSFDSEAKDRLASEISQRGKHGIPFEHLYWPIAEFAWERVIRNPAIAQIQVDVRARRSLQEHLVRRLSSIASTLLHTRFLAYLAVEQSGMQHHFFGATLTKAGQRSRMLQYMSFATEQGMNGLRLLFTRFPVAARLISEVTELWIGFVAEFLDRLQSDLKQLADRFNAGDSLGPLFDVKTGVSDPHHGGRSVLILRFGGGLQLAYKPRPMEIDRIFYDLVEEIGDQYPEPDLGILKIYDRGKYGWMEFARHGSCSNRAAAKRYYQRAGALAHLVDWLRGVDFHRENVVAAGEYPMLVDLECLAHPLRADELSRLDFISPSALARSMLRTGLLPLWQSRKPGGFLYDNSGFDGPVKQRSLLPVARWNHVNTDRMHWSQEFLDHHHSAHRPLFKGRILSMKSFERDVLTGYRWMAGILEDAQAKKYLSAFKERISHTIRRCIERPTFIYAILLRRSLEPSSLVEGIDRSIELMALPSRHGEGETWNVEITSLEKLDIPYFYHTGSADDKKPFAGTASARSRLAQEIETVKLSIRRKLGLKDGNICAVKAWRDNPVTE